MILKMSTLGLKEHQKAIQKNPLKNCSKKINKDLKVIAQNTGRSIDFRFSIYVTRHSWSTILKRKDICPSLISEGLGHTNEQVTQIYLDSFENEALDEMNNSLLY